ncbi:MAG: DUF2207 domain-containing protein [Candidatus Bathyarchaeia archaeon]
MTETKQIAMLVTSTLLLGICSIVIISYAPIFFEGDITVGNYTAKYYTNGTLIEEYVYDVKTSGKYRMLFRSWEAPLSTKKLSIPYIEFLNVSTFQNAVPYFKDYYGSVWLPEPHAKNLEVFNIVESLAENNEVGILNINRFDAGRFKVNYKFRIHPPLECDNNLCHLNLKLATKHFAYRDVTLTVEDSSYIENIYPHPPDLKIVRGEGKIVLKGQIAKDKLLELEFLFKREILSALESFPRSLSDVKSPTVQANAIYSIQYFTASTLRIGTQILTIVFPILFLSLYVIYGREKSFTVPKYLSVIPNENRKPWIVNLIFRGDAVDYDENGFYATILDLHLRGKLKLKSKNGGLTIQVLDTEGTDLYEERLINFLKKISSDGIVDTDELKKFAIDFAEKKEFWQHLANLKEDIYYLTKRAETNVARSFMVNGRNRIIPMVLTSTILFITSIVLYFMLSNVTSLSAAIFSSIILMTQSVMGLASPSTLFGKWRGSAYKEKLEWESFKNFLSDLAMIKRYTPQDISMWSKWLVYGTSLGVGDNVVKAIKELGIFIEEAKLLHNIPLIVQSIITVSFPGDHGGVSGGVGGGFGAGGGFGGGGAGAR